MSYHRYHPYQQKQEQTQSAELAVAMEAIASLKKRVEQLENKGLLSLVQSKSLSSLNGIYTSLVYLYNVVITIFY